MEASEKNSKKIFKYSLWIFGFILVSLALGYFRATDHGYLPNRFSAIPIQGLEENSPLVIEKGKPAIFYFWATWCTVCKANDPFLKASLSPLEERGITFISFDDGSVSPDELKAYLKEKNISYPVAIASSEVLKQFHISGFPTTVFADQEGKIRFVDAGIMNPISFWIRAYLIRIF